MAKLIKEYMGEGFPSKGVHSYFSHCEQSLLTNIFLQIFEIVSIGYSEAGGN
jgi:hypothetical protein